MNDAGRSFLHGAAVLGAAGLVAKIIGAVYRLPLAEVLGSEGSGYYGMAYPVYSALAAVATVGVPTAISQLISGRVAAGDMSGAVSMFRTSHRFFTLLGLVATILFVFCAPALASVVQARPALAAYLAIAPDFFFASLLSVYRGYLQGFEEMRPTAVSQLLEQTGKIVFSLTAAWAAITLTGRPEYGAAAALAGLSCSEGAALLYMRTSARRAAVFQAVRAYASAVPAGGWASEIRALLGTAFPVTIAACMMPLVLAADSVLVSPALQAGGAGQKAAAEQVGILTMNIEPLVNMPGALSSALAMSIVPAVAAISTRDPEARNRKTSLAMRMALWIGLPCAAGFAVLARPILQLLFHSLRGERLAAAGQVLTIMSICVLCLALLQTASGVLQGMNLPMLPVAALVLGGALKVVLTATLVRVPDIGLSGAAWGSAACFAAACALDMFFVARRAPWEFRPGRDLVRPALAAALMAGAACAAYGLLRSFSASFATVTAILLGGVVYVVLLCGMNCVSPEELAEIPGGRLLARVGMRLDWWRSSVD